MSDDCTFFWKLTIFPKDAALKEKVEVNLAKPKLKYEFTGIIPRDDDKKKTTEKRSLVLNKDTVKINSGRKTLFKEILSNPLLEPTQIFP